MKYLYLTFVSFFFLSFTTSTPEAFTESGEYNLPIVKTAFVSERMTPEQTEIADATQNDLVDEYYFNFKNKKYYVVRNKFHEYGLADENHKVILEPTFDKLYHPNLTISNCMEVKNGEKVGLYNLATGALLAPRFDYILPSGPITSVLGFGSENGELVELNANDLSSWKSAQNSPWQLLMNSLDFDIQKVGETRWYDVKLYSAANNQGVVILPSYLDHLKVFSQDEYWVLPRSGSSFSEGNSIARAITINKGSLSENVFGFVISIVESGMGDYDFLLKSDKLMVYNGANSSFTSIKLYDHSGAFSTTPPAYRIIDNALIEVKSTGQTVPGYHFGANYAYYEVTADGEIAPIQSARIFDYTKFVKIDESYFNGEFSYFMDQPTDGHNMYQLSHLTIADLDIMRNEIFAEYGYKFKSEKWQKYFGSKSWYKPRYNDVNDKLTAIDKANVATILKVKAAMQAKGEDSYTKKKPITIHSPFGVG